MITPQNLDLNAWAQVAEARVLIEDLVGKQLPILSRWAEDAGAKTPEMVPAWAETVIGTQGVQMLADWFGALDAAYRKLADTYASALIAVRLLGEELPEPLPPNPVDGLLDAFLAGLSVLLREQVMDRIAAVAAGGKSGG